jgi:uncharacterized protein involved in exopolysaccharide biosynthesis
MSNEIDLREYLDILIRRWQIVAAMIVIAVIAFAGVTVLTKPTYEATATIALAPSTISVSISSQAPPYYLMVDPSHRLPTAYTPAYYIAILQSSDVVDAVTPRLPATISSDSADKSLIEITTRGGDPRSAAQAATSWAQVGAERIRKLLQPDGADAAAAKSKLDDAQQALDQFLQDNKITDYDPALPVAGLSPDKRKQLSDLSRARDLADSVYLDIARDYARASIIAATSNKPTIIPAVVPDAPVSPKPLQNILIGAALGLLIGIVAAFAVEYVLRRPASAR